MGRRPISVSQRKQRRKFGRLLRRRREDDLGLGLREAARIARLDHTTLSRIESGERPARLEDLPGLAEAYKVDAEILQVARTGQIPSLLFRDRLKPSRPGGGKTETLPVRITPEEMRELMLFLGYLRFKKEAESPVTQKVHSKI